MKPQEEFQMKKILSFGLAAALAAAMAVTALAADITGISFDFTSSGSDMSAQSLLPDQEYRFPVLVRYGEEEPSHLTSSEMEDKRFTVTLKEGSTVVNTPTLEEEDGKYYLVVNTKANYTTKITDIAFQVRLSDRSSGRQLAETQVELTVGFPRMPDEAFENLTEGENLVVDNKTPVITAKQFEKLAALNSYKAVTLTGDGWEYTVNVTDLPDLNLYSTHAPITAIVQKYEDQEFKFLSFPGSPDFGVKGDLSIDVSDVEGDFDGKFYLYRYLGGKLYFLNSQYDEGEGTITFRPSQLGSYVLTNKEISDVQVDNSGNGSGTTNPETGVGGVTGAAAAVALTALVSAAAVSIRKKK